MIGKVLGTGPEDRLEGTIALTALCISAGADVLRVHDVCELKRAVVLLDALSRG
jgi:dihydropteroate synthase